MSSRCLCLHDNQLLHLWYQLGLCMLANMHGGAASPSSTHRDTYTCLQRIGWLGHKLEIAVGTLAINCNISLLNTVKTSITSTKVGMKGASTACKDTTLGLCLLYLVTFCSMALLPSDCMSIIWMHMVHRISKGMVYYYMPCCHMLVFSCAKILCAQFPVL